MAIDGVFVQCTRIDAASHKLAIEVGAHSCRRRPARDSPPAKLTQVTHFEPGAGREPHLPIDEVDECKALVIDGVWDFGTVTARCQDLTAPEALDPEPRSAGNKPSDGPAPFCHPRQEIFDGNVAVGRE